MQKVLRINLLARNQALKSARRKNLKEVKQEWRSHDQRRVAVDRTERGMIKDERRQRREDWLAGPLAPKRDVGKQQELFGTVSGLLAQGATYPERARRGPKGNGWDPVGSEGLEGENKEWEGVGNEGNIVEGDRVCVVYGKQELLGKIGRVKSINADQRVLTVEGLNMADIEIPEGTPQRERRPFTSSELPIPIDSVRLVYRLKDEETGRDRDVIVKLIRGGAPYLQREPYSPLPRHTRYIAGEDIEIPWPEVDAPTYQAFESDTHRFDVEFQSFMPSLYDPPLPRSEILDELRDDKYARDREWHDDEYVRMKVLEDARAAWYQQRKLQSPLEQLAEHKLKLAEKRAEEIKKRGLDEETLRIIMETAQSKAPRRQKPLAA
ncbi:hypothetical protein A1O1_07736 [Capronia coronata CBS 617.96]|uniref:KOW domain-containing protein n=1 Tax=Capronia coronata CBS 617.96 TaxID=1182541 RepID=W9XXF9_9EURO|nr:uncharacterized protein A1O1_07736 [Capronia coronata CBS 617.96]EXJ81671.1 hypothetical protein A1O1_07736 [Capronia coronata CBS 617.96]